MIDRLNGIRPGMRSMPNRAHVVWFILSMHRLQSKANSPMWKGFRMWQIRIRVVCIEEGIAITTRRVLKRRAWIERKRRIAYYSRTVKLSVTGPTIFEQDYSESNELHDTLWLSFQYSFHFIDRILFAYAGSKYICTWCQRVYQQCEPRRSKIRLLKHRNQNYELLDWELKTHLANLFQVVIKSICNGCHPEFPEFLFESNFFL